MINIKRLRDADVANKTILYRSPYDIGVTENDHTYALKDDSRIRATLPTLEYLLENHCKIVILTYVKRPGGKVVEELRTTPHAVAIEKMLKMKVQHFGNCVGEEVRRHISNMQSGDIIMLENTRFHPEENEDDNVFAKELSKNGEIIVFDAFPQAHRAHASTTGIMRHLPAYAGFYFEKELRALESLTENPAHPLTLVIGGAKISDKIDAIHKLYDTADAILVGGGVANVFLKAHGHRLAGSYLEDTVVDKNKYGNTDWVEVAQKLLAHSSTEHTWEKFKTTFPLFENKIQIPQDLVVADSINHSTDYKVVTTDADHPLVPNKWAALDIGPTTAELYAEIVSQSKTVFWNGPMGLYEDERYANGTEAVANGISQVQINYPKLGQSLVAGGDTIDALNKYGDPKAITDISLAGGATLEFLAGKKLPALEMLKI